MALITIPTHTRVRQVNRVQAQWSDTTLKAPLTVDATLLQPHLIRIGTLSKQDGSPRPIKGEHSEFTRVELHQRYGTTDFQALLESGKTVVKGHDIMIELRPWMASWRGQSGETYWCELPGPIDRYLTAVLVAVDAVEDDGPHGVAVKVGEVSVRLPKREVLDMTLEDTQGMLLKLEVNTAAHYGWTVST